MSVATIAETLGRLAPFLAGAEVERMAQGIHEELEKQSSFLYHVLKWFIDNDYKLQVRYDAGWEEDPLPVTDAIDILIADAKAVDDCHLFIYDCHGTQQGWLYLVWDNFNPGEEHHLVNDYVTNQLWQDGFEKEMEKWET